MRGAGSTGLYLVGRLVGVAEVSQHFRARSRRSTDWVPLSSPIACLLVPREGLGVDASKRSADGRMQPERVQGACLGLVGQRLAGSSPRMGGLGLVSSRTPSAS